MLSKQIFAITIRVFGSSLYNVKKIDLIGTTNKKKQLKIITVQQISTITSFVRTLRGILSETATNFNR